MMLGHVVSVRDPARRDIWPSLKRAFAAEVSKLDLDRSRRKHFRLDRSEPIPDESIIGFGGQCEDHAVRPDSSLWSPPCSLLVSRGHPSIGQFFAGRGLAGSGSRALQGAWSALCEAHARQDTGDALLELLRPLLGGEPERVFEHLPETDIDAISQPFANRFLPSINDEARSLLGGRECFEFRRLKPPARPS